MLYIIVILALRVTRASSGHVGKTTSRHSEFEQNRTSTISCRHTGVDPGVESRVYKLHVKFSDHAHRRSRIVMMASEI